MAQVTGVVEIVMPNRYDKEKISMLVDDKWYNQKKEFMDVIPNKGDTVTFSTGKPKEDGSDNNYIQYIQVLESAHAAVVPKASGGFKGGNTLGIELGHAANNATQIALIQKGAKITMRDIRELTCEFYDMMKSVREYYEGAPMETKTTEEAKPAKKATVPKKTAEVEFDDDLPF